MYDKQDAWSAGAGHSSLFIVQSKQVTTSYAQLVLHYNSNHSCMQNWLVWEITALAHSVGTYLKDLHPAVASCPAQIQKYQHRCALPSARSSSCWSNANSWRSLSDIWYSLFWPKLWPLSTPADSSMQHFPTTDFESSLKKNKKGAPHKPKMQKKHQLSEVGEMHKMYAVMWWLQLWLSRPRQRYTKKVRSAPVARVDDGAARRCRHAAFVYKQRRTLTWENKFHRRGACGHLPNKRTSDMWGWGKCIETRGVRHAIVSRCHYRGYTAACSRKWAITSAQWREREKQTSLVDSPQEANTLQVFIHTHTPECNGSLLRRALEHE